MNMQPIRNEITSIRKKIIWSFTHETELLSFKNLPTVCEHSLCPNRYECAQEKTVTFMIGGEHCTRNCRFCHVSHQKPRPLKDLATQELYELEQYLLHSSVEHVVITSVTRDDAEKELAHHFADVTSLIHAYGKTAELLIPDFHGEEEFLKIILQSHPQVISHNIETVQRLSSKIRPQALYSRSLSLFKKVIEICQTQSLPRPILKSGFMLGLGETSAEIEELLQHLWEHEINIVTIGQYLQPSEKELEVLHFYTDEEWRKVKETAKRFSFAAVECGAYVRSSYKAHSLYKKAKA